MCSFFSQMFCLFFRRPRLPTAPSGSMTDRKGKLLLYTVYIGSCLNTRNQKYIRLLNKKNHT